MKYNNLVMKIKFLKGIFFSLVEGPKRGREEGMSSFTHEYVG
jgi:hypothetical protein